MTDTIASLFEYGARRTATAQSRLVEAYAAVFSGRGGLQDAEIVSTDLARWSGFFHVSEPGVDPNILAHMEGRRSVFARILSLTNLPAEAQAALALAVRMEDAASNAEGSDI